MIHSLPYSHCFLIKNFIINRCLAHCGCVHTCIRCGVCAKNSYIYLSLDSLPGMMDMLEILPSPEHNSPLSIRESISVLGAREEKIMFHVVPTLEHKLSQTLGKNHNSGWAKLERNLTNKLLKIKLAIPNGNSKMQPVIHISAIQRALSNSLMISWGLHDAEGTSNVQQHIVGRRLPVGNVNYLLHVWT